MEKKSQLHFPQEKIEKFYQTYKNELINEKNDKIMSSFKEQVSRLTEFEVDIARLEKWVPNDKDLKSKYMAYISTAKNVINIFSKG